MRNGVRFIVSFGCGLALVLVAGACSDPTGPGVGSTLFGCCVFPPPPPFTTETIPVAVTGGHSFSDISLGGVTACGVTTAGALFCWGRVNGMQRDLPIRMSGDGAVRSVSVDLDIACAVRVVDGVVCFGGVGVHELGVPGTGPVTVPTFIPGTESIVSIDVGGVSGSITDLFICGIKTSNEAVCWGRTGLSGVLGDDGSRAFATLVPRAVAGGHRFASITAGAGHACAVDMANVAFCWGRNDVGQLGTGPLPFERTLSSSPLAVANVGGFTSLTAGVFYTCGVRDDRSAACWGANGSGQLGDGTNEGRPVGTAVIGELQLSSLATSRDGTCGLAVDGTAYCWGNRPLEDRTNPGPIAVPTTHRFTRIATNTGTICAIATDGAAWCWGQDLFGLLGNG